MPMEDQGLHHRTGNGGEILLVDKPKEWTSFDVVHAVRRLLRVRKAGHAGTLDPNATGLLIICTGTKTKSVETFIAYEKEYTGTMELGVRTDSFDSEGAVVARHPWEGVSEGALRVEVARMEGRQMQVPPMYSAAKVAGKPLYRYARKGRTVERTAREIDVKEFTVTALRLPFVDFRIRCSKGTYVRSLVEDLGLHLGCGATLRELRRTRIGPYEVADALTIEDLEHRSRFHHGERPDVP
jgi:tRNA pseudouridine55 synthase